MARKKVFETDRESDSLVVEVDECVNDAILISPSWNPEVVLRVTRSALGEGLEITADGCEFMPTSSVVTVTPGGINLPAFEITKRQRA